MLQMPGYDLLVAYKCQTKCGKGHAPNNSVEYRVIATQQIRFKVKVITITTYYKCVHPTVAIPCNRLDHLLWSLPMNDKLTS